MSAFALGMQVDPHSYVSAAQLAELRRVSAWRGAAALAFTWGTIAACFALYAYWPTVWSVVIAFFVMSGRHLALAILMHEGAHGLLFPKKRWNDGVTQWLTAYPMMADMLEYRRVHFQHHKHTWTERDPDLGLAAALPVSRSSFRRKMIRDLTGQTALARHTMLLRKACGLDPFGSGREGHALGTLVRRFVVEQRGFLLCQLLLLTAATLLGHPEALLLIWWLPAFTGYSVVLRIRSIAEHACITDRADPLRHTRTTLAPFWLRFFLAPHNVNYHLEHHVFMTVPFYHLPRAHRLLRAAGVLEHAEVAPNYAHVLRLAVRGA